MQLQKADLEGLFYGWLARKAYGVMRFSWIMFRRPKLRGVLLLTLYIGWHNFIHEILTGLRRSGHISRPETLQKIRAYLARVDATIDRGCKQIEAIPRDR